MLCGKCGKAVRERVDGAWHEFYGCDCQPRAYAIDPFDKRRVVRIEPQPQEQPAAK